MATISSARMMTLFVVYFLRFSSAVESGVHIEANKTAGIDGLMLMLNATTEDGMEKCKSTIGGLNQACTLDWSTNYSSSMTLMVPANVYDLSANITIEFNGMINVAIPIHFNVTLCTSQTFAAINSQLNKYLSNATILKDAISLLTLLHTKAPKLFPNNVTRNETQSDVIAIVDDAIEEVCDDHDFNTTIPYHMTIPLPLEVPAKSRVPFPQGLYFTGDISISTQEMLLVKASLLVHLIM